MTVPAQAAPSCLQRTQTDRFIPQLGQRSVIVTDKFQRKYVVGFGGTCRVLDHPRELGFQTLEQSRVACVQRGDYLVSQRDAATVGARSCAVQSVTPYTAEMEKADAVQRALDTPY